MPEYLLILIRSILGFLFLLLMTRIMGKKQLSQLTFFDYVVGITIGSIAASMSVDQNIKISNGIVSLIIWGLFPILLSFWGMKSRRFQQFTDGRPQIIIKEGEVLENAMKKNMLTIDELLMLLREQQVFKLEDVEMAVLETNGGLSIMKKSDKEPISMSSLGVKIKKETGPSLLIADGYILQDNLQKLGYTTKWLIKEINKKGAKTEKDVFIAQVDSNKQLYVDLYKDGSE